MRSQRKDKRRAEQPSHGGGDGDVKLAKPVTKNSPLRMFKRIVSNPDFGYQCMVVLLALTQNNVSMDRRIDTMTSSIDTLRNITGVLTSATQSLKTAAEAPRQIRRLVKPGGS